LRGDFFVYCDVYHRDRKSVLVFRARPNPTPQILSLNQFSNNHIKLARSSTVTLDLFRSPQVLSQLSTQQTASRAYDKRNSEEVSIFDKTIIKKSQRYFIKRLVGVIWTGHEPSSKPNIIFATRPRLCPSPCRPRNKRNFAFHSCNWHPTPTVLCRSIFKLKRWLRKFIIRTMSHCSLCLLYTMMIRKITSFFLAVKIKKKKFKTFLTDMKSQRNIFLHFRLL